VPADAALRAYTLDAARAAGLADRGVLAPGKRADLLVLSGDPLACPADGIKDVRVLQTWVNGRKILVQP
jgi:predicted amidohydrolase YtcJ